METKEPESNGELYYSQIMRHFIRDFWYLERKLWFSSNIELQNKLLLMIRLGVYSKVDVAAPDLDDHLDFLLSDYYDTKDQF